MIIRICRWNESLFNNKNKSIVLTLIFLLIGFTQSFVFAENPKDCWTIQSEHIKTINAEYVMEKPDSITLSASAKSGFPVNLALYGALRNDLSMKNGIISTIIQFKGENYSMLLLRASAKNKSGYAFVAHPSGDVALVRITNGKPHFLHKRNIKDITKKIEVQFQVYETKLQALIMTHDGRRIVIEVEDETYKQGTLGLGIGLVPSLFRAKPMKTTFLEVDYWLNPRKIALWNE